MANANNDERGGIAARKEDAIDRTRLALDLRRSGASYRQIADALDISVATAHKRVRAGLRMVIQEPAEALLKIELDRLDAMLAGLWGGVTAGDPKAVLAAVKVETLRAKLLGLEQPQKVSIEHIVKQAAEQYELSEDETATLYEDVSRFFAEQKASG